MTESEPEAVQPLSIGIVYGSSPDGRRWKDAATALGRSVIAARGDARTDLNLNVVFHIGGRLFEPEFEGVRTGRYSKKRRLLMVQAAVPSSQVSDDALDPNVILRGLLIRAVAEAESFAARRGIASNLGSLEELASSV